MLILVHSLLKYWGSKDSKQVLRSILFLNIGVPCLSVFTLQDPLGKFIFWLHLAMTPGNLLA